MLTLRGDGFSAHVGHVEVQLGGGRCRVVSTNASHVSCITPRAADLSVSSVAAVSLKVRGESASCAAPCSFGYELSRTPVITAATVTSARVASTDWSVKLTGVFGTGVDFPSDVSVLVGITLCSRVTEVPWISAAFAATHRFRDPTHLLRAAHWAREERLHRTNAAVLWCLAEFSHSHSASGRVGAL